MYPSEEGGPKPAKANGFSGNYTNSIAGPSSAATTLRVPTNAYHDRSVPQLEADPFVGPAQGTGLSPMASSFHPTVNGARGPGYSMPKQDDVADYLSTDLGVSRLIEVSGGGVPVAATEVGNYLANMAKNGVKLHGVRTISPVDGNVYITFEDIRDAGWAHSVLRQKYEWIVGYLHGNVTANGYEYAGDQRLTHLGQVAIFASPPLGTIADPGQVVEAAKFVLNAHGQLFALVRQLTYPDGSFRAMGQFCKVSDAVSAVNVFNGLTREASIPFLPRYDKHPAANDTSQGIHLEVTAPIGPNIVQAPAANAGDNLASAMQGLALVQVAANRQQGAGGGNRAAGMYPQDGAQMPSYLLPSAPGNMYPAADRVSHGAHYGMQNMGNQSYSVVGPLYQGPPSPAMTSRNGGNIHSPSRYRSGNGYAYGYNTAYRTRWDMQRQTPRSHRGHRNANNSNNHVDLQELISGRDCRTTIMLRNIPNKVDQPMLKRFVDESSFGKYDFMYLRIDFANDCNVGYAFINFAKAEYIIPFVEARANKRWNLFRSDKVAEVSYATIQGKDCLVQKFRNSSVMLEAEHYRPKLFYSVHCEDENLIGREEPFPGPDNQSKMKRSCENAEHVGLFTPNAGQHYRDEQRRRRSQYDRGTRLAVLEEMHETSIGPYYARNLNMRR
ncbi:hypothetical protein ACHAPT_007099 [Fusarium lateritium]